MNELWRGWRVLLGSSIGIGAGASSLYFYSLGLFLKPLAAEFHWSRGQASLGPLVGTLGAAMFAVPTGLLMDRIGPVRTAVGAMVLLGLSFAALGLATQGLPSFLLITGCLALGTVGTTPLSYTRLIVGQFDRQRGLALGFVLISAGLAGAVMPNFLAPLIAQRGWKAGYLSLAAAVAFATVPVTILIRGADPPPRSKSPGNAASSEPVFSSRRFQLLCVVFFASAMGGLGAVVHLPAMVSDLGATPRQIGAIAGSVGLAAIAGRVIAGLLLDRVSPRWVTAGFFLVSSVGVSSLPFGGLSGAYVGALLLGLSIGAEAGLLAFLVSRLFPAASYGQAYGGAYSMFLVGGAAGPAILGWTFDKTGTYDAAFIIAGASLLVASLSSLAIPQSVDALRLPAAAVAKS